MDKVLHRFLTHEKADFWCRFLVVLTIGLSILRGIRWPNKWASTQYLLTYDVGFVRRGFWGSLLESLFGDTIYRYEFIQSFILINYILCIAAFIGFSFFLLRKNNAFLIPLLVFFSSPAFVFFHHIIGYLDQIGFLLSAVYIVVFHRFSRFKYSILYIIIITMLFLSHEGQVFLWGGILSFMLFMKMGGWNSKPQELFKLAFFLSISAIILSLINASFLDASADQVAYIRHKISLLSNFEIRNDYFDWMVGGSERTLPAMQAYWQGPFARVLLAKSFAIQLPAFLYFAYAIRYQVSGKTKTVSVPVLLVALSLAPLMLHFFGFDTNRWNAHCVISIFMLTTVCVQFATKDTDTSVVLRRDVTFLGILVIILNMNSSNYFFDGYQQSLFPYENHILFWQDIFSGTKSLPYHPIR